jgi:hypothetical protein
MHLALSLLALAVFSPAEASTFRRISFQELVEQSDGVIQVKVLDTTSEWTSPGNGTGYIATTAHLEVIRSLDGNFLPGDELFIREAGGTVDGFTVQAIGFPQFDPGAEYVIFLTTWQDETSDWRVSGYGQGIYEVQHRQGGDEIIPAYVQGESPSVRSTAGETLIAPRTRISDLARAISNVRSQP